MFRFDSPREYKKTFGFLMFSGGIETKVSDRNRLKLTHCVKVSVFGVFLVRIFLHSD